MSVFVLCVGEALASLDFPAKFIIIINTYLVNSNLFVYLPYYGEACDGPETYALSPASPFARTRCWPEDGAAQKPDGSDYWALMAANWSA